MGTVNPAGRNSPSFFLWLMVFLVVVLVLGIDFAVARMVRSFRMVSISSGRVRDPVFHHGLRRDFVWQDSFGPMHFQEISNSLGLRDGGRRTIPPVGDRPRILLIGDSFTEGVGVPWEETFAGRLQTALKAKGVEVLNAGVASYTPILERIKVRHLYEVEGLRFGRLVLFLDLSDLKDELFYRKDEFGRAQPIPYGPFASQAGWGLWVERISDFSETRIEPNFILLGALARNLKIFIRQATRKELGAQGLFTGLPDFVRDYELGNSPLQEISERGMEKCGENLAGLADYLRARGIPMTLVIYRWPQYHMPAEGESRYQGHWREWAAEHGVDFIDLFRLFDGKEPISQWHLPGDDHWNSRGHGEVAKALLAHWPEIAPRRGSGFSPTVESTQRPGPKK
jgi:hypothetical protein